MRKKLITAMGALTLLAALHLSCVQAAIPPAVNLSVAVERSDAVVVGVATSVQPTGNGEGSTLATFDIIRTIASRDSGNYVTATVLLASQPGLERSVALGQVLMLFMRRRDASTWEASAYADVFPALRYGADRSQPTKDVTDSVVNELLAIVTGSDAEIATSFGNYSGLEGDAGKLQARRMRLEAADRLNSNNPELVTRRLSFLSYDTHNDQINLLIMGFLINAGIRDLDHLNLLVDVPVDLQSEAHKIASMFLTARRQSSDIEIGSKFLKSHDPFIRMVAASMLRQIASKESIGPLARIGIFDTEMPVRYQSVCGLIAATGRGKIPSIENYAKEEADLLTDWRRWSASQGYTKQQTR